MLNIDLVDNLYASLSKEQQQNLCSLLFKNSKQTMNYFRLGNSFATNNVNGNNNYIGNVSLSNNLLIENDSLRKEVESLKETLKAKDEALKAKEIIGGYLLIILREIEPLRHRCNRSLLVSNRPSPLGLRL